MKQNQNNLLNGEFYEKWLPLPEISPELSVFAFHYDYEGFRILLVDEIKKEEKRKNAFDKNDFLLKISFIKHLAFRVTDEMFRLKISDQFQGEKDWMLYKVKNSNWIRFFNEESLEIYADQEIKHYAIFTGDEFLEFLVDSGQDIKVEWFEANVWFFK
ncbi:MAG: hypothetical protein M3367_10125 [Acidobacteriota bacterium]|nr:hypothetical protein [Acidobacteriota bacterium]